MFEILKIQTIRTLLISFFVFTSPLVLAQSSPIKLMVGFPAGGGTDAIARILAEKLSYFLGVPVTVENRAGNGGQIAAQALKIAPPDGTVLFLSHDHTISILPIINKNSGYDPKKDFVPVAGFASFANGFALSGNFLNKSLDEFLQSVRTQQQGKAPVGVPASQSVPELLVKSLAKQFELDLIAIPYKGSAPMIADMVSNQMNSGVASVPDFIKFQKAGMLHMVAVMGTSRQAILPDTPTFAELGIKGFEDLSYYGIFAPKGTPTATIDRFSLALKNVVELPQIQQKLSALGLTIEYMTSDTLSQRESIYSKNWAQIIARMGVTAQ